MTHTTTSRGGGSGRRGGCHSCGHDITARRCGTRRLLGVLRIDYDLGLLEQRAIVAQRRDERQIQMFALLAQQRNVQRIGRIAIGRLRLVVRGNGGLELCQYAVAVATIQAQTQIGAWSLTRPLGAAGCLDQRTVRLMRIERKRLAWRQHAQAGIGIWLGGNCKSQRNGIG